MENKLSRVAIFLLFAFFLNCCGAEEKGYYLPTGTDVSSEGEPFIAGWATRARICETW